MKFCEILKFGNNLKLEIIDYIFRKITPLNEVNILESPNEYYRKKPVVLLCISKMNTINLIISTVTISTVDYQLSLFRSSDLYFRQQ